MEIGLQGPPPARQDPESPGTGPYATPHKDSQGREAATLRGLTAGTEKTVPVAEGLHKLHVCLVSHGVHRSG